MKHLANILTASRIVLALILFIAFKEISIPFLVIYFVAQLTDMVDGTVARKTNTCSTEGAILDTAADVLLVCNTLKMVFRYQVLSKKMKIALLVGLVIAMASPVIAFLKFGKAFFIHSLSSKILGGAISLVPFAMFLNVAEPYIIVALALFIYSMIENAIMLLFSKRSDADALTLYHVFKSNRELRAE